MVCERRMKRHFGSDFSPMKIRCSAIFVPGRQYKPKLKNFTSLLSRASSIFKTIDVKFKIFAERFRKYFLYK